MNSTSTGYDAAPAETMPGSVPPLENGDRLSRAEFERRYLAMPQVKKAELIEGVVHLPSPVRLKQHGEPHAHLITWLGVYVAATPAVRFGDNATVRLDLDNEPQPDAVLFLDPARGGTVEISDDGYLEGTPELVVEIASSSVSIDLHAKLGAYRRNGVREYLVWRVQDGAIDWFLLHEGRYEPQSTDSAGVLRSQVFPGLWLSVSALLASDLAQVLQTVQQGIASPTHDEFVKSIRPAT